MLTKLESKGLTGCHQFQGSLIKACEFFPRKNETNSIYPYTML